MGCYCVLGGLKWEKDDYSEIHCILDTDIYLVLPSKNILCILNIVFQTSVGILTHKKGFIKNQFIYWRYLRKI